MADAMNRVPSLQSNTATEDQRDALRSFAESLGLEVDDLRPPSESVQVQVRLSPDEVRQLKAKAQKLDVSMGVLLRALVRGHLFSEA